MKAEELRKLREKYRRYCAERDTKCQYEQRPEWNALSTLAMKTADEIDDWLWNNLDEIAAALERDEQRKGGSDVTA